MRALLTGARSFAVETDPHLSLGPDDVRLAVLGVGICGTDLATYRAGDAGPDQVLGHEIVGRVIEAGARVSLPVGTVAMVRPMRACGRCWYCANGHTHLCDRSRELTLSFDRPGGYADELVVRDLVPDDLFAVTGDTGVADAIWAEPLAVAVHCVRRLPPANGSLLVVGAGPLGLCVTAAAVHHGWTVTVVEPRPRRHAPALLAGATRVTAPDQVCETFPATVVAAGVAAALEQAVRLTRPGGCVAVAALGAVRPPRRLGPVRLLGAFGYHTEDFRLAVDLINSGRVRLGRAVSRSFPLAEINAAFAYAVDDPDAVKVMIAGASGDGRRR